MVDKLLRVHKEQMLVPVAARLGGAVSPNALTVVAAGAGLAAAASAWQQRYALSLALWAVNRVLDGLDGTVARTHGTQSDFGGYLDIVLDTVVYALLPLGLIAGRPSAAGWLALAALLSSFYINGASWMFLAALLEKRQHGAHARGELTTITMPAGLIEGAETVAFYALFLLLPVWAAPLFWVMAVLVTVTIIQRLWWAAHQLA